jgi:hypothetical protein
VTLQEGNKSGLDEPREAKDPIIEMDDSEIGGWNPDVQGIDDKLISKSSTSTVWRMKYE